MVLRGAADLKIGEGCCRDVFAIRAVTLTVPQLEGAKGRPRPQLWEGCCRRVFAITRTALALPQLEGAKGRPRAQNCEGCCRGVFVLWATTPALPQVEGAKGRPPPSKLWGRCRAFLQSGVWHSRYLRWKALSGVPALNFGGDAVGAFLQSL